MTAATTNDNNLLPSFTKMQKDADANAAAEAECMDKGVSFVFMILSLCLIIIYSSLDACISYRHEYKQ